ncbi:MAG TPA: hypothetical protein PKY78_08860, partial [Candidatus Omnitrophota bacterium]|nr:hypothetical protein [Candidatus Omnitrophota bacterium]
MTTTEGTERAKKMTEPHNKIFRIAMAPFYVLLVFLFSTSYVHAQGQSSGTAPNSATVQGQYSTSPDKTLSQSATAASTVAATAPPASVSAVSQAKNNATVKDTVIAEKSIAKSLPSYAGNLQQLINDAKKNIKTLDTELKNQQKAEQLREHYNRGEQLIKERDFDGAKQEMQKVVDLSKDDDFQKYVKKADQKAEKQHANNKTVITTNEEKNFEPSKTTSDPSTNLAEQKKSEKENAAAAEKRQKQLAAREQEEKIARNEAKNSDWYKNNAEAKQSLENQEALEKQKLERERANEKAEREAAIAKERSEREA